MSNILFGKDISKDVKNILSTCAFTVTDSDLSELYPEYTRGAYVVRAGESSKTPETLLAIMAEMSARGVKRGDTVAAFGGGVVCDITGLAAAMYMRGVEWVSVPTSLLAMVDAGIGGKTAVDFKSIKNLVGAFHAPRDIVINAGFLSTLPDREWTCGNGELIKTCLLTEDAYALLDRSMYALESHDINKIFPLIEKCVRIKDAVVTADPKEKSLRRILNVGHTVGHALESVDGFKLSHGEYVLKGMMTEATMCKDIVDKDFYISFMSIVKKFTSVPRTTSRAVCDIAASDKKNEGDNITLMVPVRPGIIDEVHMARADFAERYDSAVRELRGV